MAARKGRQVKQVENLEHHFALELDDASRGETWGERTIRTSWRSRGGQDLAESSTRCWVAVGKVVVRVRKVRMVEDVVEVGTDSQGQFFRQLEVLVDRKVGVKEARSAESIAHLVGKRRGRGGELVECQAVAQPVHA